MYLCSVYNARRGAGRELQLDSQVRLFRDGVEVFRTAFDRIVPLTVTANQITVGGLLQFHRTIQPGSYLLEIAVTDRLAKARTRVTQTVDFEVIE
jgi:hypothetical protein